jgi:Glycosyl hydrolase family 26
MDSMPELHLPGRAIARAALVAVAVLASLGVTGAGARAATTASRADTAGFSTASIADNQKRACVYDANYISQLAPFAAMVKRKTIDCAMVYTGSPDWAGWVNPWFLHHPNPDLNWAAWVRASPANDRRQLIISQPLIPSGLAGADWLDAGASGAYTGYARQFAQNLVAEGVGDAVIRLSWEMNGTWNIDSIGSTPADYAKWVRFWRLTVKAMRSVPGAHFLFDWCPNNGVRSIPLADYYPGNDVVNIIGDDAYDAGVPAGQSNRWNTVYNRLDGLSTIVAFAKAHHKPLSLPEWGVGVADSANLAGGDDPSYVKGMADVVADNDVAFQTYFYAHEWATQLQTGPRSLAAYTAAFGDNGYATGSDDGTDITPAPPLATSTRRTNKRVTKAKARVRARAARKKKQAAAKKRRAKSRARRARAHRRHTRT